MSRQMRDEFEAWAESQGYETMTDGETYYAAQTHHAWLAWKASRESLVVGLPGPVVQPCNAIGAVAISAYNSVLNVCREAIHAAGVRTE